MDIFELDEKLIREAIPQIESIEMRLKPEGQKTVFKCNIDGTPYALKFLGYNKVTLRENEEMTFDPYQEAIARAQREIQIISTCKSPNMVKMGPLGLTETEFLGEKVAYYTEEWIDGKDLFFIISEKGKLDIADVKLLGLNIAEPIKELAGMRKLHRDIKPKNIMMRESTKDFVLLDMGIAFAFDEQSITLKYYVVGTLPYFSPEQFDFTKRREMDFRSDLFSLGIVLYEAATGKHPFIEPDIDKEDIPERICNYEPPLPSTLNKEIPKTLDLICKRLLEKKRHMRYRSCDSLIEDLKNI